MKFILRDIFARVAWWLVKLQSTTDTDEWSGDICFRTEIVWSDVGLRTIKLIQLVIVNIKAFFFSLKISLSSYFMEAQSGRKSNLIKSSQLFPTGYQTNVQRIAESFYAISSSQQWTSNKIKFLEKLLDLQSSGFSKFSRQSCCLIIIAPNYFQLGRKQARFSREL